MNADINIKNIYIHKYVPEARDWKCPMPRKEHFLAYQKAGCVVHTMNDGREFAAARVINGDRSLVDVDRGMAHGIFYSGTSGICENHSAPIRAIVLPEQRAENRVFVPAHREAFMRLLNQCSYYPWDAESAALMTELVARLVGRVPIYRLDCRKDEGAVRALENELRRE